MNKIIINILLLLILILIYACDKKDDSSDNEKYFDPQYLDTLNVRNIDEFWDDTDTMINKSYFVDGNFYHHPGFITGTRYSGSEKGIAVSVFASKDIAIEAMEIRINDVACLIETGNSNDIFKDEWWYSECIPNMVFVNRWNTIIEVWYGAGNYNEFENILINTIKEVIKRVDDLSSEIIE